MTPLRRVASASSSCTLDEEEAGEAENPVPEVVISFCTDGSTARAHGEVSGVGDAPEALEVGDFVEIEQLSHGEHPVSFLQIKDIRLGNDGRFIVRGIPYTQCHNLDGWLPQMANEICMILHSESSPTDADEGVRPQMVETSMEKVLRKRELRLTNATYPEHATPTGGNDDRPSPARRGSATLVCRWKLVVTYQGRGCKRRPDERILERIQHDEVAAAEFRVPDDNLRSRWRDAGHGGATRPREAPTVSIEEGLHPPRGAPRRYTLFDAYSGAGGVSRGAHTAGFRVAYAVDSAPEVWATYRDNFPDTRLYRMSVAGFVRAARARPIRVDVLHLSPPCQFFSPAHTRNTAHDDDHIFALLGGNALVSKTRPRLVTLEQTFGITFKRHTVYLGALIGDLTQFGYSVRWRVVRLATWGSAQDRKRLIVIAAAPGEKLPPFPPPTHANQGSGGLRPLRTIRDAIADIPPGDELHNLERVKRYAPTKAPYDANRPSLTITTASTNAYHPDGSRDFTLREYASLQGFPIHHRFHGNRSEVKRQIGNAFPPDTVEVLYRHLKAWLEVQDRVA
jgi:DNA (cytosine-5)-methyltransferase 1